MQAYFLLLMFIYNPSVNESFNPLPVHFKTDHVTNTESSRLTCIKTGLWEKMSTKIYARKIKKAIPDIQDEQMQNQSMLSMFLGIFSLVVLFIPLPGVGLLCVPAAVLAIIFALKVKKKDKKNKKATAGLVLGIATLSFLIIAVLALFSLLAIGLYNI